MPGVPLPPAEDLTCPAEPTVPAEDATENDVWMWQMDVLLAGRDCRDAIARLCRWHQKFGFAGTCPAAVEDERR